jgi:DNA-binding SARP family transcriptional activator
MGDHRWHVRLLGSFKLTDGGRDVPLVPASAQLVALLALRGEPVPRDAVLTTLWPDAPVARAAANLRTAVWRLPPPARAAVVRCRTTLAAAPEVACDVAVLRRRLTRLATGEPPDAGTDTRAIDGVLLADWYDDWVLADREALRLQQIAGLERFADHLLATGRPAEALDAAMAAMTAEPLREGPHRRLIAVHLAEGNLAEAVSAYRSYRDLLADQLGVVPSPALARMIAEHVATRRRDAAVTVAR